MDKQKITGYPSIDKPWLKYYKKSFLEKPIPAMNIYSYLKTMTDDYLDYIAISYFGEEISFRQLFSNIDIAAKLLIKMGVKCNDRIMYLTPNIPETSYLLYGSARIGAIADFIDPRPDSVDFNVSARKVLGMIRDEKINHLVVLDQCYLSMIQPIEKELFEYGIKFILLVSANDSMTEKGTANYLAEKQLMEGTAGVAAFVKKANRIQNLLYEAEKVSVLKHLDYKMLANECGEVELPDIPYVSGSLAVIVHTSGTTNAKPKPIPLTHDNMNVYAHQTFGANMPMTAGDRQLQLLPYFAAFGIVDVVHACLCHINNLIQIPEFVPNHLGKMIQLYRPQIIIGTPSWFLGLLKDSSLEGVDLSCLSMITYGGDSMELADEHRLNVFLEEHNARCKVTKGHGMSETCGCASYAIGEYNVPASIGIPMPLTTYALIDPETKELLRFEKEQPYLEGELIISSGAVTPGILDGKIIVPRREYNRESYIFTRDIARMDRNGIMTFLTRSDRSFTRFDGFKIKAYEIENVMKQHPKVANCVITPIYDNTKFGYLLAANIIATVLPQTREEKISLVKEIIDECFVYNPDVSTRQIPAYIFFYDVFPMTKNGKTDINALILNAIPREGIQIFFEESNIEVGNIIIR